MTCKILRAPALDVSALSLPLSCHAIAAARSPGARCWEAIWEICGLVSRSAAGRSVVPARMRLGSAMPFAAASAAGVSGLDGLVQRIPTDELPAGRA
ncbi:MAG: hypothetical protein ACSLFR_07165 [Solirubrobacteraceae bacterium]